MEFLILTSLIVLVVLLVVKIACCHFSFWTEIKSVSKYIWEQLKDILNCKKRKEETENKIDYIEEKVFHETDIPMIVSLLAGISQRDSAYFWNKDLKSIEIFTQKYQGQLN